jgi:hypothetical protein
VVKIGLETAIHGLVPAAMGGMGGAALGRKIGLRARGIVRVGAFDRQPLFSNTLVKLKKPFFRSPRYGWNDLSNRRVND